MNPLQVLAEIRAELGKVKDLRVAIEALTHNVAVLTDEAIRGRHVNQDILEVLRDIRDSVRAGKLREVG